MGTIIQKNGIRWSGCTRNSEGGLVTPEVAEMDMNTRPEHPRHDSGEVSVKSASGALSFVDAGETGACAAPFSGNGISTPASAFLKG